ncbi:VWA domain-containing protein [candidate division KSB1 bacterium]|nr:VWA domain-containing protein [candidate division KSB1 bacterium]
MEHQPASENRITQHIIAFGRVLRRAGLEVATGQIMDAMRAMQLIGLRSRADVYQALFSIFVTRKEQVELFNQAFHLFWRAPSKLPQVMSLILPQLKMPETAQSKQSLRVKQALAENEAQIKPPQSRPKNEQKEAVDLVLTYSSLEVLRKKDFAAFTNEEVVMAKQLLSEMNWNIPSKRTRRFNPNAKGRMLDLRKTVRKNMRNEGELIQLSWRGNQTRMRDIVVLCDISGSMERYSRMLLHFIHTITAGMRRVETFVFGTRLTRITRYLKQRDIDDAVSSVSQKVNDWAGGTRIGDALKDFNYLWARRVLRSGAVVMVISDGWDRGDIPLFEREVARLSRNCYRLIWLNPLLGYENYEPLTRGIKAAMPYIDDFLPVHNLESLEQIGEVLSSV